MSSLLSRHFQDVLGRVSLIILHQTLIESIVNYEHGTNPFFCTNPGLGGIQIRHRPSERNELATYEDCEICTMVARHWQRKEVARIAQLKKADEAQRKRHAPKRVRISSADEHIPCFDEGADKETESTEDTTTTDIEAIDVPKQVRFAPAPECMPTVSNSTNDWNLLHTTNGHQHYTTKRVGLATNDEIINSGLTYSKDCNHTEHNGTTSHVCHNPDDLKALTPEELFSTLTITTANGETRTIHCDTPSKTNAARSSSSSLSSMSTLLSSASNDSALLEAIEATVPCKENRDVSQRSANNDAARESEYWRVMEWYEVLGSKMLARKNNTSSIREQQCSCATGVVGDKVCGVTRDDA